MASWVDMIKKGALGALGAIALVIFCVFCVALHAAPIVLALVVFKWLFF